MKIIIEIERHEKRALLVAAAFLGVLLCGAGAVVARAGLLSGLATNLGLLESQGRHVKASLYGESALWLADRAVVDEDFDRDQMLETLGRSYVNQKHLAKAREAYGRMLLERAEKRGGGDPGVAEALSRLADVAIMSGDVGAAESYYAQSIQIQEEALPERDPRVTEAMVHLANLSLSLGKAQQAEALYQRALAKRIKAFGETHPSVVDANLMLADFYERQGRPEQARHFYNLAVSAEDVKSAGEAPLGMPRVLMARFLHGHGEPELAQNMFARGAIALAESFGVNVRSLKSLEPSAFSPRGFSAAAVEEALETPSPIDVAHTLFSVAESHAKYRSAKARAAIEQSLQAYEEIYGPNDARLSAILSQHADLYQEIGDSHNAEALRARSRAMGGSMWQ